MSADYIGHGWICVGGHAARQQTWIDEVKHGRGPRLTRVGERPIFLSVNSGAVALAILATTEPAR